MSVKCTPIKSVKVEVYRSKGDTCLYRRYVDCRPLVRNIGKFREIGIVKGMWQIFPCGDHEVLYGCDTVLPQEGVVRIFGTSDAISDIVAHNATYAYIASKKDDLHRINLTKEANGNMYLKGVTLDDPLVLSSHLAIFTDAEKMSIKRIFYNPEPMMFVYKTMNGYTDALTMFPEQNMALLCDWGNSCVHCVSIADLEKLGEVEVPFQCVVGHEKIVE